MPRTQTIQRGEADEDLVRLYLDEIGQHPLLTKDDEVRLAQAIEAGREARAALAATPKTQRARRRELERLVREGEDAERTFVLCNLRLVVSIAKRYQASGLPLLDLVQEGNLGLMHAVEKFDWRKGFKFSTYATWWIRQAIQRGIANTGRAIRLPAQAGDELARLRKAYREIEEREGRSPDIEELAVEADLSVTRVRDLLDHLADPVSLEVPVGEDGETKLGELVPDRNAASPVDEAIRSVLPEEVRKLLEVLDERERQVLVLLYGLDRGEPRTPAEVAEVVDLGRERVRQLELRALARLRHPSVEQRARSLAG